MYTFPLGDICKKFGIHYHCCADDTQVYLSFQPIFPSNQSSCICNLENCIAEAWKWLRLKLFKLNDDKTEFILALTHQQLDMVSDPKILIGINTI